MTTTIIRAFNNIKSKHLGAVVTIGNFDGIHLGHQALLSTTIEIAKKLNVPSMVITFEPHPVEYFQTKPLPRLSNLREKLYWIGQSNIDHMLVLPFNQALSELNASDFMAYLQQYLQAKHIIVGDDFHFGAKRSGDVTLLKKLGDIRQYQTTIVPALSFEKRRISSTWVREALQADDLDLVTKLLGHPYTMLGRVRGGDQRGRLLGFPTANIFLHRKLVPVQGVYTVLVHGVGNKPLPGVANVGVRPTVDGTRTLLEVHLLDFSQDIYGYNVRVEFCKKLRAEQRYPSLDLLKAQIAEDVRQAYDYFKK